ncbi:hypothetical protein [Mesonia sp. K4-1]|uniref:hypothetical protein n=1 Tax=Mesonia sp. K4-1 TaxID=2602760 RepID=UPI0011C8FB0A|nr:hypothetical protein [Mesonia sp. K4-1]TXK78900.1 hypothetical protein FT986_03630 [Mesonia sp. K4-1]
MKAQFLIIILIASTMLTGCEDIIEVDNISEERVKLLAPADDVISNSTTISFSWEMIEEADAYQLQVAKPSFEEAIEIVTDTTSSSTRYSETYSEGNFEWRVKALNSAYETEYTTHSFSIVQEE